MDELVRLVPIMKACCEGNLEVINELFTTTNYDACIMGKGCWSIRWHRAVWGFASPILRNWARSVPERRLERKPEAPPLMVRAFTFD